MKTFLFLALLFISAVARAETPNDAAKVILELVTSENYSDLARNRYAEWYKAELEKTDAEEAIARLSAIWKKRREVLLSAYTQLTTAEFTLGQTATPLPSETGETATAKMTMGTKTVNFTFYRMKTGVWGFRQ
jgi:hypothetical protein